MVNPFTWTLCLCCFLSWSWVSGNVAHIVCMYLKLTEFSPSAHLGHLPYLPINYTMTFLVLTFEKFCHLLLSRHLKFVRILTPTKYQENFNWNTKNQIGFGILSVNQNFGFRLTSLVWTPPCVIAGHGACLTWGTLDASKNITSLIINDWADCVEIWYALGDPLVTAYAEVTAGVGISDLHLRTMQASSHLRHHR